MDIQGIYICGFRAVIIRDLLREFNNLETKLDLSGSTPRIIPNRMSQEFIKEKLEVDEEQATQILECLIESNYIDTKKYVPTTNGMALINAEDRNRISRKDAENILKDFLVAVKKANQSSGRRVFIEKVFVFGSFENESETLGDIDLVIESPMPEDCIPEDLDEQEALIESIKTSDYLSFHDEHDPVANSANKRLIYERKQK